MAIFKCKMCGGNLEISDGITVAECEYCGTRQTVSKSKDEVVSNLFSRANNLRLKCEFDKAEQIYEKILDIDNTDSEAHWGIVLCKYGIEYVEDPKTFRRVPTCHRTLYDAVTADVDYLAAIENADIAQKELYVKEAAVIDGLQKDILNIVNGEKPFDVFICYKEKDENGKRTPDSAIANDIYHQLTQEGFKVFYAAITLEDKLGQEYEPYIFAALNSAKVMLVVGTKPQYFDAVWVRNEWSRFLKLMKIDHNKLLIPCFKDMDAYELPEAFAHLQAQDMGKIGFINDVVRGIKKVVSLKEPTKSKETVITNETSANIAPLLERAFMFLEDGEFDRADEFCEQVLNMEPKCAEAYLGKLMVDLCVKTKDDLKNCAEPFDKNNNYQKAVRFADDKLKNELLGWIEHINTRNENARLEEIYDRAKIRMLAAKIESDYISAASIFETIFDYKDSDFLAKECHEKAEIARKDAILADGKAKMTDEISSNYESVIKMFESISGWKDADELTEKCKQKIGEIKAKEEAERLEQEHQSELARKEAERIAKKNKKIAIIATSVVCVISAFIIVLNTVIIPNGKYNDAIALMDEGKYTEAYNIFKELGDYKDASDKADNIRLLKTKEQLKNVKVGDYVEFGVYEQDNDTDNGKEDIEWLVLEIKDDKALIISKYALNCKPYNTTSTHVTWENCTLRKWINNDFANTAFSDEEKAMIPTVTVSADKNPEYSTNPGNATQDQIFLLSIAETNKYFNSDSARECEATVYAIANGLYVHSSGNFMWWLRSPGHSQNSAARVDYDGDVDEYGSSVNYSDHAVRPALWISLK